MAKRKEKQIRTPKPNTVGDTPFEVVDVKGKEFVVIEKNKINGKASKTRNSTINKPISNSLKNLFGSENNAQANQFLNEPEPKKVPYNSKKNLKPRDKKTRRQYLREYSDEVKLISRFKFVLFYAKRPHYLFIKGVSNRFVKELNKRLDTDHSRTLVRTIIKVMKRNFWRKVKLWSTGVVSLLVGLAVTYYHYNTIAPDTVATEPTPQSLQLAVMNWNIFRATQYHVIIGSYSNQNHAKAQKYGKHIIENGQMFRVCAYCCNSKQEALLQSQMYSESWIFKFNK